MRGSVVQSVERACINVGNAVLLCPGRGVTVLSHGQGELWAACESVLSDEGGAGRDAEGSEVVAIIKRMVPDAA